MLLFACLLEMLARIALPVSNYPDVSFDSQLGRHFLPNQSGRYIKGLPTEIDASYSINSSGWNSPRDYSTTKPEDIFRIAVIGDSFVEALQVDVDSSFSYLLETQLNAMKLSQRVEVYSYGHSGANLAQYLSVLRHQASRVRPDLVIVTVVPNDYRESLEGHSLDGFSSVRRAGGTYQMVAPGQTNGLLARRIARRSALARYLMLNLSIQSRWSNTRDRFRTGGTAYEAHIRRSDMSTIGGPAAFRDLLTFLLGELQDDTLKIDASLVILFDANRRAIEAGDDAQAGTAHALNQEAITVARELGVSTIDLREPFEAAWALRAESFSWRSDGHWNDRGHRVVARAVADWMRSSEHQLFGAHATPSR